MLRECYEIIQDEALLEEFLDWLPECGEGEQFLVSLFSRKKYCPELSWVRSDKMQLVRKTSKKERLKNKLRQMEVPIGAYTNGDNIVPQDSLVAYISPNPRDLWRANFRSLCKLSKVIEGNNTLANPQQEVMSEIQRTCSNKRFITFDLDSKDENLLEEAMKIVGFQCDVTQTRGGFHIFVHKDKIKNHPDKKWYPKLAEICDVCGDELTPIVGCCQGGFVPKFKYRIGE